METFRQMRAYCKAVAPRNVKMIKLDKEKTPIFDKYQLEDQIRVIYQDRVELKSGGSLVINPTEAMITIDVNSGRGSNKRNVEETAFKTNMEAAEEIARQLRLRDLGGLVVIDFIDMMDAKHNAEVEKTFKKAIDLDRARIQLSHISKFGLMELSRQKKQSTIQEISYTPCPFCRGRGVRPSLEYTALTAYRKIETQAVKGLSSVISLSLPYEVADYLQNQKRSEINHLENEYDMSIHISGDPDMAWDECKIDTTKRETPLAPEPNGHAAKPARMPEKIEAESEEVEEEEELPPPEELAATAAVKKTVQEEPKKPPAIAETKTPAANGEAAAEPAPVKKKTHRRSRHRRKKPAEAPPPALRQRLPALSHRRGGNEAAGAAPPPREPVRIKPPAAVEPVTPQVGAPRAPEAPKTAVPSGKGNGKQAGDEDPLLKLKKIFETLGDGLRDPISGRPAPRNAVSPPRRPTSASPAASRPPGP